MKKHTCDITGDVFIELKATIGRKGISKSGTFNPLREFSYGDNKAGLNISVIIPTVMGKRHKLRNLDIVCFEEKEFAEIYKLKLAKGAKVELWTRQTAKGLVIDEASDITKIKAI